jgi:hypothetical protein
MLVYILDRLITRYLPSREELCAQFEAGLLVLDKAIDDIPHNITNIRSKA